MSSGHDAATSQRGPTMGGPAALASSIRVMKFGGTSVGDLERIKKVAARVKQSVDDGGKAVVVVSAMGRTTDRLLTWAREIATRPSRRELDVLAATGEQ